MGFLSGLGNLFGIGGGSTEVKNARRRAQWTPPQMNVGGFDLNYTLAKKGQDSITAGFSPENAALRDQFYGLANQGISNIASFAPNYSVNVGNEFGVANDSMDSLGLPPQFYDPETFRALTTAAGGLGQSAFADAQGLLQGGSEGAYNKYLQLLRDSSRDEENNLLQGNMDKQFLRGILGSTAGGYQTDAMVSALGKNDINRQLQAYGISQDALNNAFSRAGQVTGLFQGLESDATNRGFLLNQLAGNRANERFGRAMQTFGAENALNNQDFARALQMLGVGGGGIDSQDAKLAGLIGLQGQLAAARSGAQLGAGQLQTNYNLGQQGMWASMLNNAMGAGATFDPTKWG